MADPSKPSPSPELRGLVLAIRLGPILAGSAAGAALGYHLLLQVPKFPRTWLTILFLILFVVLVTLKHEPGWNLALLIGFEIAAGALLGCSGLRTESWPSWISFLALLAGALLGAWKLGAFLLRIQGILLPLSVLYLAGCLGTLLEILPGWLGTCWLITGLALFTLLAASLLQRGSNLGSQESLPPLGIDLALALLNLFWLCFLVE